MNKTTAKQRYDSIEDYEENCYLFSQSIGKQRTVGGKTYYIRSYFKGGKDFNETVERLAVKQATKNAG